MIFDSAATNGERFAVNIQYQTVVQDPAKIEMTISEAPNSEFGISAPETVVVPKNGSVILRSENSPQNGKATFLWLIIGEAVENG